MKQHTQVVTIHAEAAAYFVFVPVFKKNLPQKPTVAFRKLCHNIADLLFGLPCIHRFEQIDGWARQFVFFLFVERNVARSGPIVFRQYVIADRVHKRS